MKFAAENTWIHDQLSHSWSPIGRGSTIHLLSHNITIKTNTWLKHIRLTTWLDHRWPWAHHQNRSELVRIRVDGRNGGTFWSILRVRDTWKKNPHHGANQTTFFFVTDFRVGLEISLSPPFMPFGLTLERGRKWDRVSSVIACGRWANLGYVSRSLDQLNF